MDDKRTSTRAPCTDVLLPLTIELDGDARFYTGLARNISSGGIFVHTFSIPPVGTALRLRFTLKGYAELIDQPAVVAWIRTESDADDSDDVGFGARFPCLPPELTRVLDDLLRTSGAQDFYE